MMSGLYSEIAKAFGYKKPKKPKPIQKQKAGNNSVQIQINDRVLELYDAIEDLESKMNRGVKVSIQDVEKIKQQVKDAESDRPNQLYNEEQIEEDLVDEGSPLESGRYDGMSYKQIVAAALQGENEATEIALALIEKADNEEDIAKFVEIANDENDHSLVYQGILNRLNGLSN